MNDQNRYEEVPQKQNPFVKGLKAFGNFLKFSFVDFINSFKYNNMKLASILFALPGLFLGFFMFAHYPTINHIVSSYYEVVPGTDVMLTATLNADTDDATDYKFTIGSYTINDTTYTNVVLEKDGYDESAAGYNQNNVPVNGYAETATQTTQISQPTVTLTANDTQDSYTFTVNGLSETELSNVQSYSIFIYKYAGDLPYHLDDCDQYSVVLDEGKNSTTLSYKTLGVTSEENKYAVTAKAIAKSGTTYYSSDMSELSPVTVKTDGSEFDSSASFTYLKYQGNYSVTSATQALDDNLKSFTINISKNGTAIYKIGNTTHELQLGLTGSGLETKEIRQVNLIPFDFSGIAIFVLTLFGFLSVFISLELSKKKNFGSVIKALLIFVVIAAVGAMYIYSMVATNNALASGNLKLQNVTTIFDTNGIISMSSVIASIVFSLAGLILSFINYDRTYEKVDR